jgi:outer membrane receptor for ferrienterochelin and colicins
VPEFALFKFDELSPIDPLQSLGAACPALREGTEEAVAQRYGPRVEISLSRTLWEPDSPSIHHGGEPQRDPTFYVPRKAICAMPVLRIARSILIAILLSAPLAAQSVDYGALEQMFNEPVTTSVDGSPQRVSDAPATMEIITAEDIRRSGAKDIPGVLRHVGGVDTLEWGNDDVDVGIRGYDQAFSPRLLVLVDGRQVYTDDFSYTPWITVPVELSMIRQIEIVKGTQSALFGFNAAGGVINIITKNPLYDEVNTASATGGTQALGAVSLVATHHFGTRGAVRLSAGGDMDSDFSTPIPASEYEIPRTEEYRAAFNLNGVLRLSSKMQLGLDATQSVAEINEMGQDYGFGIGRYAAESVKMDLREESRIGLLHVSGYTNWLRETSTPGDGGADYRFDNRVTVAQIDDTFRVGSQHILRAALEYRRELELSTPTTGATILNNDIAASGMWSWKITPAIALTNAVRMDHRMLGRDGYLPPNYPFTDADWDHSFTVPSFNSSLIVKPNDTDSVRLMISRGTQLPSLSTSGAVLVITPTINISGSPFVNPMTVTNYEIGWDHDLAGQHLLVRVSAFHQNNQDLLAIGGATAGPAAESIWWAATSAVRPPMAWSLASKERSPRTFAGASPTARKRSPTTSCPLHRMALRTPSMSTPRPGICSKPIWAGPTTAGSSTAFSSTNPPTTACSRRAFTAQERSSHRSPPSPPSTAASPTTSIAGSPGRSPVRTSPTPARSRLAARPSNAAFWAP